MTTIEIKPLSVNQAWIGRRYKTEAYKTFEGWLLLMLPNKKMPEPPFEVHYEFGFSSRGSDLGNPEKMITDILSKRYRFNDNQIYKMTLEKKIVPKGKEYIKFEICSLT